MKWNKILWGQRRLFNWIKRRKERKKKEKSSLEETCVLHVVIEVFKLLIKMEVMFDCFFDETFARLERSGLQSRQKRRDVIDHLNAIILGASKGMCAIDFFFFFCSMTLHTAHLYKPKTKSHNFHNLPSFPPHCLGQNVPSSETCALAVMSAIDYHQRKKHENNDVRL